MSSVSFNLARNPQTAGHVHVRGARTDRPQELFGARVVKPSAHGQSKNCSEIEGLMRLAERLKSPSPTTAAAARPRRASQTETALLRRELAKAHKQIVVLQESVRVLTSAIESQQMALSRGDLINLRLSGSVDDGKEKVRLKQKE